MKTLLFLKVLKRLLFILTTTNRSGEIAPTPILVSIHNNPFSSIFMIPHLLDFLYIQKIIQK